MLRAIFTGTSKVRVTVQIRTSLIMVWTVWWTECQPSIYIWYPITSYTNTYSCSSSSLSSILRIGPRVMMVLTSCSSYSWINPSLFLLKKNSIWLIDTRYLKLLLKILFKSVRKRREHLLLKIIISVHLLLVEGAIHSLSSWISDFSSINWFFFARHNVSCWK